MFTITETDTTSHTNSLNWLRTSLTRITSGLTWFTPVADLGVRLWVANDFFFKEYFTKNFEGNSDY
jgi:hypothetical protein